MIRPIGNRVLVKRLPVPEKTQSGLFILGREYPLLGQVLAIGTGKLSKAGRVLMPELTDGTIAIGDLIYFHKESIRQGRGELGYEDLIIVDAEHCLVRVRDE
jgi:chaperonin GroES